MDDGEERGSVLWSIEQTSTSQALFSLLAAATGSGGMANGRTFEVDLFSDGLIISQKSALSLPLGAGDTWVPWEDVAAITLGEVTSDKDAPWLVFTMKDGTPVNLGPGHLLARTGSKAAAKEAKTKSERLISEWEAWKTTIGPSTEEDASA